jgi:tetrahydromethanopterin S-methyltransferase subunit D
MALRRVGNDFMEEEEYEVHAIGVWSFWIFIIAAGLTGYNLQEFIPDEWPKWARFTSTIVPSILVGGILGVYSCSSIFLHRLGRYWFIVALGLAIDLRL